MNNKAIHSSIISKIEARLREGVQIDKVFEELREIGYEWHDIERAFMEGEFGSPKDRALLIHMIPGLMHIGIIVSSFLLGLFWSSVFMVLGIVFIAYFIVNHLEHAHKSERHIGTGLRSVTLYKEPILLNHIYLIILITSVMVIYASIAYSKEDATIVMILCVLAYLASYK